jgi:polysaccharide export outer membrane protein
VPKAPVYYIYGEVQRPGSYRIERGMTIRQALALAGGLTARGTERRMKVERQLENGEKDMVSVELTDVVRADDVIYVRESLF